MTSISICTQWQGVFSHSPPPHANVVLVRILHAKLKYKVIKIIKIIKIIKYKKKLRTPPSYLDKEVYQDIDWLFQEFAYLEKLYSYVSGAEWTPLESTISHDEITNFLQGFLLFFFLCFLSSSQLM